ncbi:uncharacterized protein LOC124170608 [Ischnura elegans]|uniref:uncharacterized protein LOC124170608 n=1 Tax=Ischnura elegans TaxID=197161 RepID=UPI001ED86EE8|nr:uncharacterized protein LOC124170608 [Ischnura elegans]
MAASDGCPRPCRLFVTDAATKTQFLVDTGSDLCVYPRARVQGKPLATSYELFAANGTIIKTYGWIVLCLNLGLRRDFKWRFIIADVDKPIIGADFLSFYGLLVDIRHRRLLDGLTSLSVNGRAVPHCVNSVSDYFKFNSDDCIYLKVLREFPEISRPTGAPKGRKHPVEHHIRTTPGPSVSCKPLAVIGTRDAPRL